MSMKKPQLGMSARKTVGNTVYHIFMVTLSVIMIYPFVWSLLSSFKSSEQLYGGNPLDLWPRPFTMENYERLFQVLPFDKFTVNSVFLSVAMPLCMIAVASLTAYALTRLEFRGRNILFLAFIATMMIPSHVTLIPNYKIVVDMKLINTYAALFLTNMFTGANAFNIFFFRQFFLSIPKDLENAAIIDGCTRLGVVFRIVLPNAGHCHDGHPVVPQCVERVPVADAGDQRLRQADADRGPEIPEGVGTQLGRASGGRVPQHRAHRHCVPHLPKAVHGLYHEFGLWR